MHVCAVDSIRYAEAARILGVTTETVRGHVLAGRLLPADGNRHRLLSRAAVEALALGSYQHRRHKRDKHSLEVLRPDPDAVPHIGPPAVAVASPSLEPAGMSGAVAADLDGLGRVNAAHGG